MLRGIEKLKTTYGSKVLQVDTDRLQAMIDAGQGLSRHLPNLLMV